MKTAISLPDSVFREADAYAQRLGISRSELYANAVREYLARRIDERVTAQLNAVYAAVPAAAGPELAQAARLPASRADLW